MIPFVVLQRLRRHPKETLGKVGEGKDRLQREPITGGMPASAPVQGRVATAQLLTA